MARCGTMFHQMTRKLPTCALKVPRWCRFITRQPIQPNWPPVQGQSNVWSLASLWRHTTSAENTVHQCKDWTTSWLGDAGGERLACLSFFNRAWHIGATAQQSGSLPNIQCIEECTNLRILVGARRLRCDTLILAQKGHSQVSWWPV